MTCAIEVSRTELANMNFDEILDITAVRGAFLIFYISKKAVPNVCIVAAVSVGLTDFIVLLEVRARC